MPKIRVRENDNTGSGISQGFSRVVFIPGKIPTATPAKTAQSATLFANLKELEAKSADFDATATKGSYAYAVAKHLLRIGFQVVMCTVDEAADIDWDYLANKNSFDLSFITCGDFPGIDQAAINCAKKRGDCICLVDHAKILNPFEGETYADAVREALGIVEFDTETATGDGDTETFTLKQTTKKIAAINIEINDLPFATDKYTWTSAPQSEGATTFNNEVTFTTAPADRSSIKFHYILEGTEERAIINGEYAAAFTPWIKVYDGDDFTEKKGTEIPASYGYLFAYANASISAPQFQAIAGPLRGIIPELVDVLYSYTAAELNTLTNTVEALENEFSPAGDGVGTCINPITDVRPNGVIVYGNRTLRYNAAAAAGSESAAILKATSFLNVRNMVSLIKKKLFDAGKYFTFEQNNAALWINFKSYCNPLLSQLQSAGGILGYRFTQLPTTAKARLKASLDIVPIEPVEDFDLTVNLEDSLDVAE